MQGVVHTYLWNVRYLLHCKHCASRRPIPGKYNHIKLTNKIINWLATKLSQEPSKPPISRHYFFFNRACVVHVNRKRAKICPVFFRACRYYDLLKSWQHLCHTLYIEPLHLSLPTHDIGSYSVVFYSWSFVSSNGSEDNAAWRRNAALNSHNLCSSSLKELQCLRDQIHVCNRDKYNNVIKNRYEY